jgi:adenosine deaminase
MQSNSYKSITELHTHLYGCMSAELLYEIGKNNPSPRWEIYTHLYSQLYKEEVDTQNFFKKYNHPEIFKEIYYFNQKAPFLEFQSKFNLIIALCKFDPEEIKMVSKVVLQEYAKNEVDYVEFRIMYSPLADEKTYYEKTLAACQGLSMGEQLTGIQGRLVVSLHRDFGFANQYLWLKKAMSSHTLIQKYLVGIDFCNVEEGFPPKEKKYFFNQVLGDNLKDPKTALSILYHVGESFQDKTHLSASRWILEASQNGAHRLGHCIALFENLEKYIDVEKIESPIELKDTYNYLRENHSEISSHGRFPDLLELKKIFEPFFSSLDPVKIRYTESFLEITETFRNYVLSQLIRRNSVVESCPSSNYLIGMIDTYENLPIKKMIDTKLKCVISADDPGIFETDLQRELKICESIGISREKLQMILKKSKEYTSTILSGREKFIAP